MSYFISANSYTNGAANHDTDVVLTNGKCNSDLKSGTEAGKKYEFKLKFKTGTTGASNIKFQLERIMVESNASATMDDGVFGCNVTDTPGYYDYAQSEAFEVVLKNFNEYGSGYGSADMEGEVSKILLPNREYYLWIFPIKYDVTDSSLGHDIYIDAGSTVCSYTESGSAGLCHMKRGGNLDSALIWIKQNGELKRIIPSTKRDGNLHICS